jgi:hypothetical protein
MIQIEAAQTIFTNRLLTGQRIPNPEKTGGYITAVTDRGEELQVA